MKRVQGRNIYIVDLNSVVHSLGSPQAFAHQCQLAQFSAVWIRLGHGASLDANFTLPNLAEVRQELSKVGVGVWGWHVPQCPDDQSVDSEVQVVTDAMKTHSLDGVLLDAEQDEPGKKHFFLGNADQAKRYAEAIRKECDKGARGLALSSHDQPQGKPGFPFGVFLDYVIDNCPQVYYSKNPAKDRLKASIDGYTPLEKGRDFKDRYRPVGNITIFDDVPLPSLESCIRQTKDFISLIKVNGFKAYSFWCWDEAPAGLWQTFHTTPV
jgi:hypothetical protein